MVGWDSRSLNESWPSVTRPQLRYCGLPAKTLSAVRLKEACYYKGGEKKLTGTAEETVPYERRAHDRCNVPATNMCSVPKRDAFFLSAVP